MRLGDRWTRELQIECKLKRIHILIRNFVNPFALRIFSPVIPFTRAASFFHVAAQRRPYACIVVLLFYAGYLDQVSQRNFSVAAQPSDHNALEVMPAGNVSGELRCDSVDRSRRLSRNGNTVLLGSTKG